MALLSASLCMPPLDSHFGRAARAFHLQNSQREAKRDKELPIGESPWRNYDKPLTEKDFLGDVPKKLPQAAVKIRGYAFMSIRYEFRAMFTKADDQVTATLTKIEIFSSIDRKKSWLDESSALPPSLLDHLQGHFDLVEIEARKARKDFATRLDGGSLVRGMGKDENEAIIDLQKNIDAGLKSFGDRALKAREVYDKVTRNGTLSDKLKAERRRQKRTLGERSTPNVERPTSKTPK